MFVYKPTETICKKASQKHNKYKNIKYKNK